jgi:hypothetical protein
VLGLLSGQGHQSSYQRHSIQLRFLYPVLLLPGNMSLWRYHHQGTAAG